VTKIITALIVAIVIEFDAKAAVWAAMQTRQKALDRDACP
jgi:hypothetical protein